MVRTCSHGSLGCCYYCNSHAEMPPTKEWATLYYNVDSHMGPGDGLDDAWTLKFGSTWMHLAYSTYSTYSTHIRKAGTWIGKDGEWQRNWASRPSTWAFGQIQRYSDTLDLGMTAVTENACSAYYILHMHSTASKPMSAARQIVQSLTIIIITILGLAGDSNAISMHDLTKGPEALCQPR
jgi:hypothetical protein